MNNRRSQSSLRQAELPRRDPNFGLRQQRCQAVLLSPAMVSVTNIRASMTLVLALLASTSCGPKFNGRVYQNGDLSFKVGPTPEHWRPIEVDQALLAYRDDRHGATVALNGRCHKDGDDVPLASLTHHLFLHFTEREVLSQKRLDIAGRESLRTELKASLDGVPKHYVVYVLKKDGCVYDFLFIADSADVDGAPFDVFVSGFETVST